MGLLNRQLDDEGVHTFIKGSSLKENVIAQLEFELPHYGVTGQHVSHDSTATPILLKWFVYKMQSLPLKKETRSVSSPVIRFINSSIIRLIKSSIKWFYYTVNKQFYYTVNKQFNYHHHQLVVPLARISLTISRHFSLSFIASGRPSGLHPVPSHSCCMYVRAGHPAFARPYAGVHWSTSLMTSSLLLQQCSACLVRLTWIVFVMRDRRPYSVCFVGSCRQDLFNIARNIFV